MWGASRPKKSGGDSKSTEKKGGIESRIKVIAAYAKRVRAALTEGAATPFLRPSPRPTCFG